MVLKALLRGLGFVTGLFAMAGCSGMPVATFVEPAQNTELACDPANASLRDSTDVGAALSVEVVDQDGRPFRNSEVVTVSDMSGMGLISLECSNPWAHFVLNPGRYRVSASLGELQSNEAIVDLRPQGANVTLTMQPEPNANLYAPDIVL